MKRLARPAAAFLAIGLALYAALFAASEQLLERTARINPVHKARAAAGADYDWVILGASHAMALDFGDFNAEIERATASRVLNLAAPGTGPLYQRFALEEFLRGARARGVLYAVDSFAFCSRDWNEERFADAKLTRRTPFAPDTARHLAAYARDEGVGARAVLDYASGFSKINNRERFRRDTWEGEAQFDRVHRPSASALAKRIDYLYPDRSCAGRARYLGAFAALLDRAARSRMRVVVVKMPVPPPFAAALPEETAFDEALARVLAARGVALHDFSRAIPETRYYFDTDHLNRAGAALFLERDLAPLLRQTL